MSVKNLTVVITGSSSGVGEAAAKQMARAGARVCLVARREDELLRVKADIEQEGGLVWIYACDLTQSADVAQCAARLLSEHERIDVLVNNAARSIRRPIVEALDRLHDYERTMQINFFGALGLTLQLLPRFLEQGEGHVVNVSTMSSQVPIPLFSAYLASKTALESFSRSLMAELGHKGITTTIVYFPMIRTPMSSKTSIYKHMRMMDVERAGSWLVDAVVNRPARVSSLLGSVAGIAVAAMPGPVSRLCQPFFRRMDKRLKQKLAQDHSSTSI